MTRFKGAIALALGMTLSACVGGGRLPETRPPSPAATSAPHLPMRQPVPAQPLPSSPAVTAPNAANAYAAGIVAGPPIASLPLAADNAERALAAFRTTCRALASRAADPTGLTQSADWQPACDAAQRAGRGSAVQFFQQWFETAQVGDGRAYATGYYVPEIAASRERGAGYDTPIYARPDDLIDVNLGLFSDALKGKTVRGRVDGTKLVPYYDRGAIDQGALAGKAKVLAWAADPVEFFFLQIQGSGLLRLPDGTIMRIGYDSQNGRDYTGIGALMKARGLLQSGQTSMQGIVAWLNAHPDEGRAIMRENKSFVFFRELQGPPLGAMGLPVADATSVAVDTKYVPLGAPVFLSMDRTDATGLWVAQDTGGAIKGANRFDTYWGAGDEARAIAGGMSARGTAFVLVPVGTLARLRQSGVAGANDGPATRY